MSEYLIFIALAGEDCILTGRVEPETGRISAVARCPVPDGPEMLDIDPTGSFLFAGCHPRHYAPGTPPGKNRICSFAIDRETGALTPLSSVELEAAPVYLRAHESGRYLLTAYYLAGGAAVHPVGPDGVIGAATQLFPSGGGAHSIMTDPSGRFVYLPHIAISARNMNVWPPLLSPEHILPSASNSILQFRFDAENGRLLPNEPFRLVGERGGGPRHLRFHPALNVAYCTNEQGCSVTAYAMDPDTGVLTPFQLLSTLPCGEYVRVNTCSSLRVTRSGRFLYVMNRGYNSIACFAIDAAGALTLKYILPIDEKPRELEITPDDRYLLTAGYEDGSVGVYGISGDGELTPRGSLPLGRKPMWILAVPTE